MKKIILTSVLAILLASLAWGGVTVAIESNSFDVAAPHAEYSGNMGIYYSYEVVVHLIAHKSGIGIMCSAMDPASEVFVTVNSNESVISAKCSASGDSEDFIDIGSGTVLNYSRPVNQGFTDTYNETDYYKSSKINTGGFANIKIFFTQSN